MPKPPKDPTRRDSAAPPQATPTTPRTRLFWVSFDDADDEQSAEVLKTPEQIYQEALMDTIETLLNEQTASPPGPPLNLTAGPAASPQPPSPDTIPTPVRQTSMQADLPPPQHSVESKAQPNATHAGTPPVPPAKPRRQRKCPPAPKAAAPAQTQPPVTAQRLRVRRDLQWPGENSSSPSGS
jgi:hypothetical protein